LPAMCILSATTLQVMTPSLPLDRSVSFEERL
jgi:hypothetical protein